MAGNTAARPRVTSARYSPRMRSAGMPNSMPTTKVTGQHDDERGSGSDQPLSTTSVAVRYPPTP